MSNTVRPKAEYKKDKPARIISDYKNDLIFEQPRENLLQQEFTTYEYSNVGMRKIVITRKFKPNGDYFDTENVEIIGF